MTKKDYILIAEAIKATCLDAVSRKSVVAELGLKLAEDNPRFNYNTFKRACGVSDTPYSDDPEGRPSGGHRGMSKLTPIEDTDENLTLEQWRDRALRTEALLADDMLIRQLRDSNEDLLAAFEASVARCQFNCTTESYCGRCEPLIAAIAKARGGS